MTASALVKQSDLRRMANIAKSEGVTVWVEVNGKRVGVSPEMPLIMSDRALAPPIEIDL